MIAPVATLDRPGGYPGSPRVAGRQAMAIAPTLYPRYLLNTAEFVNTLMSDCEGSEPITARVSPGMLSYIDNRADELGVSRAEFVRLVLDVYHEYSEFGMDCPDCGMGMELDVDHDQS